MRPRVLAVLACLHAGLAVPAGAQTWEVVPFGGYRFGGSFEHFGGRFDRFGGTFDGSDPLGTLEVKESGAWGVSVGVTFAEEAELEALYTRQDTRLATDGLFTSQPRFALDTEVYHLGGNYLFGDGQSRLRPYVGMGIGLTRLIPEPADFESETRFSASFAGGLKYFVGAHIGVRLEARGFVTVLESDSKSVCSTFGPCLFQSSGFEMTQVEMRGGVILRF
jgi:outer membrane protein with beta-barrel domain